MIRKYSFLLLFFPIISFGLTFQLPAEENSIVGHVHVDTVRSYDDVTALSERNDVGAFELSKANPNKDIKDLMIDEEFFIPSRYVLPASPRQGIIINLAELRLYYYPPNKGVVMTYPVGIGKEGASTPVMHSKIVEKKEHPRWFPSADTRQEAEEQGIVLPRYVEAGPDNPLGNYAMRLNPPQYLIHGTNDSSGVGFRSSAGCIRMYPEDIEELYSMVNLGTPVVIINERFKAGWEDHQLELESHAPLDEKQGAQLTTSEIQELNNLLTPFIKNQHAEIDWDKALAVAREESGIPEVIGKNG